MESLFADQYTIIKSDSESLPHLLKHKVTGELFEILVIENPRNELKYDLVSIEHPNLLKTLEVINAHDAYYIRREYIPHNLVNISLPLSESEVQTVVRSLIDGLLHLHSLGIFHHTFTLEDIYFRDLEDLSSAVLAGYCLSQLFKLCKQLSNNAGAPEILMARGYDNKVDSWNVGILIYKLLSNSWPFPATIQSFESILRTDFDYPPEQWDVISDDAIDAIDNLLVIPSQRFTLIELLQHPWLGGRTKNARN